MVSHQKYIVLSYIILICLNLFGSTYGLPKYITSWCLVYLNFLPALPVSSSLWREDPVHAQCEVSNDLGGSVICHTNFCFSDPGISTRKLY